MPEHIRLSYRPPQPVAIVDLPDTFWAVQLIALSTKESLEAYADKYKIRGMSAARVVAGDQLFYVLLLGIYETRENAEKASQNLPDPYHKPWIRTIKSLKDAMIAADARTGTSQP